jgi:rhamnulokinase
VTSPTPEKRAMVAIDLGAESCRVSLLRWHNGQPEIELVHRLPNGPVSVEVNGGESLRWPLDTILAGVEEGLLKAAALAPEGIQSIAVDGWAVDYVRLGADGKPLQPPYCYRDERNIASKARADEILSPEQFFLESGAQPLRINTVFQLMADAPEIASASGPVPWVLLPEYVLHWLGGRKVAEYTNATHTGLVDIETGDWSASLFDRLGLDIAAAPAIAKAGTLLGKLQGGLAALPSFSDTDLLVPACHDTASAIAAIPLDMEHTAYIVSGTWSLVGTLVAQPITSAEAQHAGFTNQGAAAGGYCFHTNINGMWILKQCLDHWHQAGRKIELPELIRSAESVAIPHGTIDVDDPPLMLAGDMPERINQQLKALNLPEIDDAPGNEAVFARLIFASLAKRYAIVLKNLESLTGRTFHQITILGGGSRNTLLSKLTEETTGIPIIRGEAEGSTLGNFAVQLAAHDASTIPGQPPSAELIRSWASRLIGSPS